LRLRRCDLLRLLLHHVALLDLPGKEARDRAPTTLATRESATMSDLHSAAADPAAGPSRATSQEAAIRITNMHKWFGEFHVLKNINLTVETGERIVICGPSGSGKSTLIRCINRLEEHQKGEILVNGVELTGDLKNIAEIRREVGMVFQHFNLFPHLTVLE